MKYAWLFPVVLVGAVIAAFANSYYADFVYDDEIEIEMNFRQLRSLTPPWRNPEGLPERFVPYATFALNQHINDWLQPEEDVWKPGYRLGNIAIHLISVLLAYGVVRRTLESGRVSETLALQSAEIAFWVACVWGVHPLLTQAVTYTYQRLESLMAMFFLLTLYALIRSVTSLIFWRRLAWGMFAIVACAAGMASKEVMLAAPLVMLWYDRVFVVDSWSKLLRRRWWLHLLLFSTWGVLFGCLWAERLHFSEWNSTSERMATRWEYLRSESGIILHYLRLSFWPTGQCLDYDWPIAERFWDYAPAGLAILALLALTGWATARWPTLGFLGGAFFLILGPSSSLHPVLALSAEHRMYLPLLPVVALTVLALFALLDRDWQKSSDKSASEKYRLAGRWLARGLLLVAVCLLGVATYKRNEVYYSRVTMWQDVLAKSPSNYRFHHNMSNHCLEQKEYLQAKQHAEHVLRVHPKQVHGMVNHSRALYELGEIEDARKELEDAVTLYPACAIAQYNLGVLLLPFHSAGARDCFERAVASNEQYCDAYNNLIPLIWENDPRRAERLLGIALELDPNRPLSHVQMGMVANRLGKPDRAEAEYQEALRLNPGNGYALRLLHELRQREKLEAELEPLDD